MRSAKGAALKSRRATHWSEDSAAHFGALWSGNHRPRPLAWADLRLAPWAEDAEDADEIPAFVKVTLPAAVQSRGPAAARAERCNVSSDMQSFADVERNEMSDR